MGRGSLSTALTCADLDGNESVVSTGRATVVAALADSDTEGSGQLVESIACDVNVLVEWQALAVITELVGAVDEGGLHP